MVSLLLIASDNKAINQYVKSLLSNKTNNHNSLLIEITPEKTEYSIKDIRDLIKHAQIYFSQTRYFLLPNFHNASIEAQNAFLKILEEPPTNIQIIITTSNLNLILPTIRSRTKIINLEDNNQFIEDKNMMMLINQITTNPDLKILGASEFQNVNKEKALLIFDQLTNYFRQQLDKDKSASSILKEILLNRSLLETNNLNPQLTVDHILIFVYKKYKMKLD